MAAPSGHGTPPRTRANRATSGDIPRRALGTTGAAVSALGLGGYHIGSMKSEREAIRLIHAAIDAGVTFLDNAWEYHEGRSETIMGKAIADRRDRVFLMTKLCTHGRGEREAMRQLEQSLRRLRTDHLDLWQIHECVYDNDPERHFAPRGAADALLRAQRDGKVRWLGFTGHKRPEIHLAMLAHDFPFDTCQLPLNPFDASFRSFERRVLPELLERGIAPIGMKSLGGDARQVKERTIGAEEGLRYAMSLPVATTVSGIDSMRILRQNLRVARGFRPFSPRQMDALRKRVHAEAADGRYELYKTTARHEGTVGREQHGFPGDEELTA
jgi:aryl-alcohol dehydrogenase-like predicted oxidoreductase